MYCPEQNPVPLSNQSLFRSSYTLTLLRSFKGRGPWTAMMRQRVVGVRRGLALQTRSWQPRQTDQGRVHWECEHAPSVEVIAPGGLAL